MRRHLLYNPLYNIWMNISYELWSGSENDEMIKKNKLRITSYLIHMWNEIFWGNSLVWLIKYFSFIKKENWNHDIFHFLSFHLNQCQRRILLLTFLSKIICIRWWWLVYTYTCDEILLSSMAEWVAVKNCILPLKLEILERWVNGHFVYLWR